MLRSMTRTWWLVMAAAVAGLATLLLPMASADAQGATNGRVRIMHASPDTPAVDIFVDGAEAVTALAFPNNTGYVSLPAGSHNVKVFVSPSDGTGAPALEADLNVEAGKDYTVLAVGKVGDATLGLLPLVDNNASPAAGKAHVRLIHASPDAPPVDVVVAGTTVKVFSNVEFKGVGDYTPVDAATYNLDVVAAGTSTVAKSVTGLALKAQTVYTVVAVGLLGDSSLQVLALEDAAAPSTPSTGSGIVSEQSGGLSTLAMLGIAAVVIGAAGLAVPALARRRA